MREINFIGNWLMRTETKQMAPYNLFYSFRKVESYHAYTIQ